jgi:hypothetical protein
MYASTTSSQLRPAGFFGPTNMTVVVSALLVFALSVILNIYGGSWGVGNFGPGFEYLVGPFSRTGHPIIIIVYVTFGLMLLYAAVTSMWPSNAYWYALIASALSIAITFAHGLVNHHTSVPAVGTLRTTLLGLIPLLLLALFLVLYKLWLALYHPIEIGCTGLVMRNIVSFAFGWALFSAVYGYVGLFSTLSFGTFKLLFWILELIALIFTIATVYRWIGGVGLQSLIGFVLLYAWVLIGWVLAAQRTF